MLKRFREEWNVVGIFYFTSLTSRFAFSLTMMIETIYLVAIGLSFLQIGTIYLIYGITHAVFEIPTGIVADNYGRKLSSLIGFGVCGLSYVMIPLNDSFIYLTILFSLFAFGSTFISGAFKAWIVDTLKSKDLGHWIHRVNARFASISGMIGVPASLIGALVLFLFRGDAVLSPTSILILRIFFLTHGGIFLFNFLLLYSKGEEVEVRDEEKKEGVFSYLKRISRISAKLIRESKVVFILLLSIILFFFAFTVLRDAWQPLLTAELGFPLYWLGIASAFTSFFSFLINIKSESFKNWIGSYPLALMVLTLILGLLIMLFSMIGNSYFVIFLYVTIITIFSFYRPIRGAYLHENIPSKIRATIGSIDSFSIEIAGGLGSLILFGYVGDFFDLGTALKVAGVLIMLSSLLYLVLMARSFQDKK